MNEKKAKMLRKKVYGDTSLKVKRSYVAGTPGLIPKGYRPNTIINHPESFRAKYQAAKKGA